MRLCKLARFCAFFARFCAFFARFCALAALLCVSVRFFRPKKPAKKMPSLRRILQKCANSAFVQHPLYQHFYFSHRPPLLRGRHLSGSWGGSVLSRFSVGFGRFQSFLTETDQKLTKNRPKVDPLQGVRSECAVYEGWRSVAEIKVSTPLDIPPVACHWRNAWIPRFNSPYWAWSCGLRNPTPNPEIREEHRIYTIFFRKVRASFSLVPCDTSQEPNENCFKRNCSDELFILGGFFRVDFPPLKLGRTPAGACKQRTLLRRVLRRVLETAFEKVLRRVL